MKPKSIEDVFEQIKASGKVWVLEIRQSKCAVKFDGHQAYYNTGNGWKIKDINDLITDLAWCNKVYLRDSSQENYFGKLKISQIDECSIIVSSVDNPGLRISISHTNGKLEVSGNHAVLGSAGGNPIVLFG